MVKCRVCGGAHWTKNCPQKVCEGVAEPEGLNEKSAEEKRLEAEQMAKLPPGTQSPEQIASGKYTDPNLIRYRFMRVTGLPFEMPESEMRFAVIRQNDRQEESEDGKVPEVPTIMAISGEAMQHVSLFFQSWRVETRGWALVVPLRPQCAPYFFQHEGWVLLRKMLEHIASGALGFRPERGRCHVVGVSNGGASAYKAAIAAPDLIQSLTIVAGDLLDEDVPKLPAGVHCDGYVGTHDFQFLEVMRTNFEALKQVDRNPARLTEVDGATHRDIGETIDKDAFWQRLEQFRHLPP